jgi:hypothetical protein
MIATFTYPLPDELYIEGVSGIIVGTYTYDGPEKFDVQIDPITGDILDIDIQNDPKEGPDFRKTINASKNIEAAYLLSHYFVDDYVWEYEFEDEIMENGDVYKKLTNPNLSDVYQLRYDFETNDWKLDQILKQQDNPSTSEAKIRKEYIEKYSSKYSFGEEVDSLIENYIEQLDTFIENNPPLKTWKYINFDFKSVPKIPAKISIEISKLSNEGVV